MVLVDERDLWPDGQFVTTHLIVRTEFLEEHPDLVQAAPSRPDARPSTSPTPNPSEAQAVVNDGIEAITGNAAGARGDRGAPGRT